MDSFDQSGLSPEELEMLAYLMAEEGLDTGQQTTIRPRDPQVTPPLSFAQERLWFVDQWEPGNLAYNIPLAVRLSGRLDRRALEWSLNAIIARHEALRTTFPLADDLPIQLIAAELRLPLVEISIAHLPEAEREAEALRLAVLEAQHRFDLQRGPLLRATLVTLDPTEHLFLLNMHHIIFDGWSMGLFLREISTLYAAHVAAPPETPLDVAALLPRLPIQYADVAIWQRAWLQGDVLQEQLDYWLAQLQDSPVLQLRTDRPRPPVQTSRGALEWLSLPPELTASLTALSQQEDGTLFMLLLAAFNVLLQRYSGQDDIIVGSPIANRDRYEFENVMGFFVNTLLLRSDLSGNPSFRELLRRVRAMTLQAYAHQNVPFEQLVEVLRPERDPSYTPLFQVMFILQNTPMPTYQLPDLTLTPLEYDTGSAKFDLTLILWPSSAGGEQADYKGLSGSLEYNTDLFDASTIARMVRHFTTLLVAIARDPDQPIDDLLFMPADEQQLLLDWAAPLAPTADGCLHQLIAAQAALTPDALAVTQIDAERGTRSLSYAELEQRANQLAHHLRACGVASEQRVGLLIERSPEMIVGLLAVLKIGAAYVPLDPAYPAERIAFMVEDAAIGTLLSERRLLPLIESLSAGLPSAPRVVQLDADWPLISRLPGTPPAVTVHAANLAYVIYTSGSTGQPKGVLIPHQAVANYLQAVQTTYGLRSDDRVLQFASLSFDASAEEIYPCLTSGATLVLRTERMLASAATFFATCRDWELSVLSLPTAYWHELCAQLAAEQVALPLPLRLVIIGGERAQPERLAQWQQWAGSGLRLINTYGPTEATIVATAWEALQPAETLRELPIGRPLHNVQSYMLDRRLRMVPIGVPGELYLGGAGLARGYLDQPALTAARFVPDPFSDRPGARLYKTGDQARYLQDGTIEFLGRVDEQVKIRGFRIEPGEIAAALQQHPAVREALVLLRDERLVAYVVEEPSIKNQEPTDGSNGSEFAQPVLGSQNLRAFLKERLPEYMVPSAYVLLPALPLTTSGKIDRRALPAPEGRPQLETDYVMPSTPLEQTIAEVWRQVLQLERVGIDDNFFDLGGQSLRLIQVQSQIRTRLGHDVPLVELFRRPTVRDMARYLSPPATLSSAEPPSPPTPRRTPSATAEIAIIGMSGRFPGASTIEQLWHNLQAGIESVRFFSEDELRAAGIAPQLLSDPAYVRARAVLEQIDGFDAGFFGYTPREAELIDPQHRLFLECAWEALERAGYPPSAESGAIGVFGGAGINHYLLHLLAQPELLAAVGHAQTMIGNEKDYLATRVAYKLNLRGPSVAVQTACSTSLVAVHLACQSLRQGECAIALAGGVSLPMPQTSGYLYQEGDIHSPDGHCRSFDQAARGTVTGSGVGVVALKRLEDALHDGDPIYAVIKGSAINNDGAAKVGYTAPSVDGQAEVIAAAQRMADIAPDTISYIEAHGTGTPLGDPIEIAALKQVFGTRPQPSVALGSIKTNIGHLDAASGVAGLIKATLALQHEQLPPSLHFSAANPALGLDDSPFYVNSTLKPWPRSTPRRAGVSSFGIGGTNAHVVLEEAPPIGASDPGRPWLVLPLSAKTPTALEAMTDRLADALAADASLALADVAYTLQLGRAAFAHRRMLVCRDRAEAIAALRERDPERVLDGVVDGAERRIVFLFPGQGAQYVSMAQGLYQDEPVFRASVDRCCELLRPLLELDLRDVLYPAPEQAEAAREQLNQTWLTQPALFVIEYALAQLWLSWGLKPAALVGHSLGEVVAATLAGVFTLADALELVVLRGRWMHATPPGAMLSVALPEAELRALLSRSAQPDLALAVVNSPSLCVVAGPAEAVAAFERTLSASGIETRRLQSTIANHSPLIDAAADALQQHLATMTLQPPRLPYLSNVTGGWISAADATDPAYWARHMRSTVQFAANIATLLADPDWLLLEVGPGRALSALAQRQPGFQPTHAALHSLRRADEPIADQQQLQRTLGRLWLAGAPVAWAALYRHEQRRRVLLPTYPFERQRYWIAAAQPGATLAALSATPPAERFYVPSWQRATPPSQLYQRPDSTGVWLVLEDQGGFGQRLSQQLEQAGQRVVRVRAAESFARATAGSYTLDPAQPLHYQTLLAELQRDDCFPGRIAHLWSLAEQPAHDDPLLGSYTSLLLLARALADHPDTPVELCVISGGVHAVTGDEQIAPEQAALLGPCQTIPLEYPHLRCRHIDLLLPRAEQRLAALSAQLTAELLQPSDDWTVAYRGGWRWLPQLSPIELEPQAGRPPRLRAGGSYAVVGGRDGSGLALARSLAETVQAQVALVVPEPIETLDADERISLISGIDASDVAQLRAALALAGERLGALHGLIYAAEPPTPQPIDSSDPVAQAAHLHDLLSLAQLGRDLDLLVLCSTLDGLWPERGGTLAGASHAMLGALARQTGDSERLVSMLSWERVAGSAPQSGDGSAALERLLWHRLPELIVARSPSRQDRRAATAASERPTPAPAARHARPLLAASYVAPRNDVEESIAAIWQELFGIQQIGIYDNFFDLGGHSLLATRLLARLRDTFDQDLPMRDVFEATTIAELAALIVRDRAESVDQDELAALLGEIQDLSPEEVQRLLLAEPELPATGSLHD